MEYWKDMSLENIIDEIEDVGENNLNAKVNIKDVQDIVKLKIKTSQVAKIYQVSQSCIDSIRRGRTWSRITGIKYAPIKHGK